MKWKSSADSGATPACCAASYTRTPLIENIMEIAPPTPPTTTGLRRTPHELYYLEFVVISTKVQDTLYKLPRAYFEQNSEHFQTAFAQLKLNNSGPGLTPDEQPFIILNVKRKDFDSFLKVFLSQLANELPNSDDLVSAMKLSHMWGMRRVRTNIIKELWHHSVDPVTKITLAIATEMREWLLQPCMELATRDEPLSVAEGEELGWEFAVKMWGVRERVLRKRKHHFNCPACEVPVSCDGKDGGDDDDGLIDATVGYLVHAFGEDFF
ncbi:hypothetical protein BD410DRAFT_809106 [Rickenella mellea]|uniref:BTB domain-containing protein n=1 Tax=Rickenella mellea TaxID=50990 RepID=A0A4Y7PJ17_9AGAM|nr:hypothetical protein BD410DRAFT_809106 [Rickenella mellea]